MDFSKVKNPFVWSLALVLALLLRFEHEIFNVKYWSDEMAQIIAAKSVREGHQTTLPFVLASDLSQPIYIPLKQFPEGYSYLLALAWGWLGAVEYAVIFWQMVAVLVFAWAWYLIYNQWKTIWNPESKWFLLGLLGLSLSPWWTYKPTDLLALACVWAGLACLLVSLNKKWYWAWVSGGLFGVAMTLRYAYQPVGFAMVGLGLGLAVFFRKPPIFRSVFFQILGLGLVFGGFTLFFELPGNLPNEAQTKKLYLENLTHIDQSLATKPFLDDRIITMGCQKIGWGISTELILFTSMFFLCLAGLGVFFYCKNEFQKGKTTHLFWTVYLVLVTGVIVSMLVLLSALALPQQNDYLQQWTYVKEPRYFAIFFQTMVFFVCMAVFGGSNSFLQTWGKRILLICIMANGVFYVAAKKEIWQKDEHYFNIRTYKIAHGETQYPVVDVLPRYVSQYLPKGIVVYAAANRSTRYAQYLGAVLPFPSFDALYTSKTSKPVTLLVHASNTDPYTQPAWKQFYKNLPKTCVFACVEDTLWVVENYKGQP